MKGESKGHCDHLPAPRNAGEATFVQHRRRSSSVVSILAAVCTNETVCMNKAVLFVQTATATGVEQSAGSLPAHVRAAKVSDVPMVWTAQRRSEQVQVQVK